MGDRIFGVAVCIVISVFFFGSIAFSARDIKKNGRIHGRGGYLYVTDGAVFYVYVFITWGICAAGGIGMLALARLLAKN
jgi:hypothetical protein